MDFQADEIAKRLIARQQAKVAEAQTRLAEEQRKLALLESLAGDLKAVIREVGREESPTATKGNNGPTEMSRKGEVALPKVSRSGAPASNKTKAKPERILLEQEILEFADRMEGEFSPQQLKKVADASQSDFQVALRPLQCSLSRMGQHQKGVLLVAKGSRWKESTYKTLR